MKIRDSHPNASEVTDLFAARIAKMNRLQAQSEIRSRVQIVPLGDGLILSRVLGQQKMLLRAADRGFSRHVMMDGYWEIWLTLFCARHLQPGMVVFDVGANLGYYTLLFADAVGPQGRLVSIEPHPDTFELLRQSVELNGYSRRTRLVRAAATAVDGEKLRLFAPSGEPKNATLERVPEEMVGERFEVESIAIDTLAAGLSRVDFLKIDVEGAERSVVEGMRETVRRHRPTIVLEYNRGRYDDPEWVLRDLGPVYPQLRHIDFRGEVHPLTMQELLARDDGEDWLLLFDAQ